MRSKSGEIFLRREEDPLCVSAQKKAKRSVEESSRSSYVLHYFQAILSDSRALSP